MARVATTGRVKMRTIASVAKFDGTSSQIDLGTGGAIAAATATFSCTCYLKRDKATGLTAMVGDNNNAAQNHWNFQIQGPNRKLLSTIITTSGAKALIGVRNIPQGFWYSEDSIFCNSSRWGLPFFWRQHSRSKVLG